MRALRVDFELRAGDQFAFRTTASGGLTGVPLRCTVKRNDGPDVDAIAEVDTGDGGVEVESDSACLTTFGSDVTSAWPIASLRYDLQADPGEDESYTVQYGTVRMRQRCTRTISPHFDDPITIFGASRVAFQLEPEAWTAASWADLTSNLTETQATPSRQFTLAGSINGNVVPRADGSDDNMLGTLVSPLLTGTRPYLLVVLRAPSGDPGSGNRTIISLRTATNGGVMFARILPNPVTRLLSGSLSQSGGGGYTFAGPVPDTSAHVLEFNFLAATTGRFLVDGVAYDTATGTVNTGTLTANVTNVLLNNTSGLGVACDYGTILCLRDQPTAPELALLYAWLEYRWGVTLP